MIAKIFAHWPKISTGLLVATLLGAGGFHAYQRLSGDCCQPGASCCYPGSPCCNHGKEVAER
ncbi:MAG: hypothetical protein KF819_35390 [Labilithrix sp.]|nr:hypothetical protein [Labilithrix sp.]